MDFTFESYTYHVCIVFQVVSMDDSLELDNKFSAGVVVEIVGFEHLGREEGCRFWMEVCFAW